MDLHVEREAEDNMDRAKKVGTALVVTALVAAGTVAAADPPPGDHDVQHAGEDHPEDEHRTPAVGPVAAVAALAVAAWLVGRRSR